MDNHQPPVPVFKRVLCWLISGLLIWQPVAPAFAAALTPQGPTSKDAAGNGVPVINIATPNSAGVSHNQFHDYNVGPEGLILNNATGQMNQTQLGGLIQNNPNLKAGHEAQAIINEVNGGNRSQLQGYTEVAGKAANVMVANPYGITCNGCGFINTPNVTLTTGKPQFDASGKLIAVEATKGSITVEGKGLDAANSDALTLISRATEINAAIHAKDLTVVAGANRVGSDGKVTPVSGEGSTPAVAVDTGALGGMYANRIHLVSSDKGVGVNLGNLVARQGDITLDSSGQLRVNNSLASGALTARAQGITLTGEHQAGGGFNVTGQNALTLDHAAVSSGGDAQLNSDGSLNITGGTVTSQGNLSLSGKTALNTDDVTLSGAQNTSLASQAQVQMHNSLVRADKSLAVAGKKVSMEGGTAVASDLSITGDQVANNGLLQGGHSLKLNTSHLDNLANGTIHSASDLALAIPSLNNQGLITSDAGLQLSGNSLINGGEINGLNIHSDYDAYTGGNASRLLAQGELTLNGQSVNNSGLLSAQDLHFTGGTLENQGTLQAAGNLSLGAQNITNTGSLLSDNGLTLNGGVVGNSGLVAATDLAITGQNVTNSGTLQGTQTLQATAAQLENRSGGKVLSGGDMSVGSHTLTNGGLLQGKTLNLSAGTWANTGNTLGEEGLDATVQGELLNQGKILSQKQQVLQAQRIDNRGTLLAQIQALHGDLVNSGIVQGSDALSWQGASFTSNTGAQVIAGNNLQLVGDTLTNQGQLEAKSLSLNAASLANSGTVQAQDNLAATVSGQLENLGSMLSQNQATLSAASIGNSGSLAADSLSLSAPQITSSGLVQGNTLLQLTTRDLTVGEQGRLASGGALNFSLHSLNNQGTIATEKAFSLDTGSLVNSGDIAASALDFTVNDLLTNRGTLLADTQSVLRATTLNNSGTLAGNTLSLAGQNLDNQGLIQGAQSASVTANNFNNGAAGRWLSAGDLTFTEGTLTNSGLINGDATTLSGTRLVNSGRIAGNNLSLQADTLSNDGLWQGNNTLNANGQSLKTGAASRTLSGGVLNLVAGQLQTAGTLQGQQVTATADDWGHTGSLVSQDNLTGDVSGTLSSTGALMSQSDLSLAAGTLDNRGDILSDGGMTLGGQSLVNSGTVQGKNLALQQNTVTNNGTLTGLESLTMGARQQLMARLAMAAPQQVLVNNGQGQILTGGTLNMMSGQVTNAGTWQGQNILLNAASLNNTGAIQSNDALQLTLSGNLVSGAGSKITAMGKATLQALALSNQGQWAANNLTLNGDTFSGNGSTSAVNGLDVTLTGTFEQQQNGALLTGGALSLDAASVNNAGKIQGNTLQVNTGPLTNSGRMQGDNGTTLSSQNTLVNQAGGLIISGAGLTLGAQSVQNNGLLQSTGNSQIGAATVMRNDGRILSGGQLTLTTPQYTDTGWLQASGLTLNATTATNSGKWLADQATLGGSSLTNQGTIQAGSLGVNYQKFTNNGTALGSNQLTVTAQDVTQNASGRLFSNGDLLLGSNGLDTLGQIVALGNVTLKLANAFTGKSVLAAGKTLSVTSNGAITNQNVMQGQAVNLAAGGQFTNNGKITTGSGSSTLSGSSVALNSAGSVQGGGDVTLTSRGDITVAGFTGTLGNLILNAPGSVLNTALLYAGRDMALYAGRLTNQRGDILAGNNLFIQKDSAGHANSEVTNTSGTIETCTGDITLKTGHLVNTRDGLSFATTQTGSDTDLPAYIDVLLSSFSEDQLGYRDASHCTAGGHGGEHCFTNIIVGPSFDTDTKTVITKTITTTVSVSGGAARISSGKDLIIQSGNLENNASQILADGSISLSGSTLSNKSYQAGTTTESRTYQYDCPGCSRNLGVIPSSDLKSFLSWAKASDDFIRYTLSDGTSETQDNGELYRAVIQAGGNITASFTNNLSNTNTTSGAGHVGTTIATPTLTALSQQGTSGGLQKQGLQNSAIVAVNSPQWQDQIQGALQQVNGGTALENNNDTGLATVHNAGQQRAGLGQLKGTASNGYSATPLDNSGKVTGVQGKQVDTSAYPLPSGNNGYFVASTDAKGPYLITVNPALNQLGQQDLSLFNELSSLTGVKPTTAAQQENRTTYTDQNAFLGSSYLLGRLNLNPDTDYRFLGDAAFDTRYVSNAILNQTGSRYLNGVGSDLDQMRYLMDNAASAQKSLGLQFGESLSAAQIASLDHSILWWESTTINGQTVMVPKLYLAAQDATVNNGSVIAGNNVNLKAGNITSDGSTVLAANSLALDSDNSISNLNDGLIKAGGGLSLSAVGDINNISATIAGKTVSLESLDGSINNLTQADTTTINARSKYGDVTLKNTALGNTASITAEDGLALSAGKNITVTGATLTSGGDMLMQAWGDIAVNAQQVDDQYTTSGLRGRKDTNNASVTWQGSNVTAGGNLSVQAGHDLTLAASDVNAGGSAQLAAANDLNLNSGQTSKNTRDGASETHSTGLDRTTVSAGNNLVLQAGQDINAHSAALAAEQGVGLQAGRDVNLLADETTQGDSYRTKKKTVINDQVRQQGTEIASGANTVVIAGRDVNSQAAQVTAKQDVGVTAGRDINLSTAQESDYSYFEEIKKKKGFLSKKTTHTITENSQTHEQGTLLSGKNVSLNADNNVLMEGSAIAAEGDVSLKAGNDVTVEAATDTSSHYSMKKTRKSGVFGSGLGITIGSQSSTLSRKGSEEKQSDARSVIGTTGGNVIINAGSKATLSAVDVVAARDKNDSARQTGHIDITASDIAIIPGRDVVQETVKQSTKSSGVGISLSNPIIDTVRNIRDIVNTRGSGITQGKLLAGEAAATAADLGSGTTLPISFGRSSSKSESSYYGEFASGSNLNASGNIQLNASGNKGAGNVLIGGSRLGAGEAVIIDAKNNVDITTSTDKETLSTRASSSSWSITSAAPTLGSVIRTVSGGPNNGSGVLPFGMAKSGSSEDRQTTAQTGSQISGNDIYITSHNGQVNLSGSALSSIDDLLLSAEQGSINVSAGNNSVYDKQKSSQSMVGSLGGDGYSGTVGYSSSKSTSLLDRNQQSTLRSQIASKDGNVSLQAKQDVAVNGADISAGKSLVLKGENILLDTSNDDLHTHNTSSSSQYGVTASASGWAVSAAQALENAARSTEEGRDPRLSAIYAAQSGLNIASQTVQSDMNPAAIKVTVSATAGTSAQTQDYRSQQQQGSHLSAGDSVILNANQDITAHGVDINGKNVVLNAGRDISLQAAQDTDALKNHSNGSQYSLGVGFALAGSQNGFSIEVGASQNKTKENGDSLTNHNTQIQADDALTLKSGRDTLLNGAVLSGDKVVADIGRNLTISSLQDSEQYKSQSSSSGVNVSICVPPICAGGPVQGSVNVSSGKITNNYQSVVEQSGIFAGKGGFDIQVGNHTQLDGAVIASDAEAAKNRLSTDTLGWSDIHNEAKSGGSQFGLSLSGGVQQNETSGQYNAMPGSTPSATLAMVSDSATSTTHSAVAPGSIIIRDATGQQQDVADLSRDTAGAQNTLENNFDQKKIEDRLAIQQQATALGSQAMDAWMNSHLDDARKKAREELAANGELAGLSEEAVNKRVEASATYKEAEANYGVGSTYWTAGTAVTGLLSGVLGGNIQGGMASGAAPVLARLVKDVTEKHDSARVALHTLVSAALAKAQGGNAVAGGVGGLVSSVSAQGLAKALYNKDAEELTSEEKSVVTTLVTALASAGGSVASGDTRGMVSAGNAARVEVENNSLSKLALEGCAIAAPCRTKVAEQLLEIGVKAGITGIVAKEIADKISADELDHLITLKMMGNDDITSKYLGLLEGKYGPSNTGGEQIADSGPTNTGGNQTAIENVPTHTGNNQASGQGTTNTGNTEGVPDTGGNTTITPIPEQNKEDLAYLALKGKEAQEAAKNLGFDRRIPPQKAPFDSHGQPVFYNGKNYITPDVDSHNVSNGWKLFNSKGKRIGTYDSELNKIKD